MSRRVGFGDDDGAKRAGERGDDGSAGASDRRPGKVRLIGAAFILIWLGVLSFIGLSAAGVLDGGADVGEGSAGRVFILGVVGLAWLFGLRALVRTMQGKPLRNRKRPPGARPDLDQREPDGDYGRD